jgi:hypothetical protein
MERVQLLLEPAERKALKQMSAEKRTSMSDVVREMLRERMVERKREKLRQAAELMAAEYRSDHELTALSDAYFEEDNADAA